MRDQVDVATENVVIVWDAVRRVVWRNASGTYIADHVRGFNVGFLLGDGRSVEAALMGAGDWSNVRAVSVTMTVAVGAETVRRSVCIGLGVP